MSIKPVVLLMAFTGVFTAFGIQTHAEKLRAKLDSADRNYVFVIMHRGDWRNAPENSSAAILGSIEKGADVVELDVAKTKDGHFVLLHDGSLDRVSNGKGASTDFTLEEIKQFRLKGKGGKLTEYPILSLEEALALTKGKILVNLDKFWRDPQGILEVAKKCGVEKEIVFKDNKTADAAKKKYGKEFWNELKTGNLFYMPIIDSDRKGAYERYLDWMKSGVKLGAYELGFAEEEPRTTLDDLAAKQKAGAPRIWINTLWNSLCAGHTDERGFNGDAAGSWGWCLDQGATMIQTDRPIELIKYLKSIGRRKL